MTIDITEARALVETLKDYAEHPSSFTDISPTEADAAADLIAALLDEVDYDEDRVVRAAAQLKQERDTLAKEVDACASTLPGPYYMDPPDGGDVPISEQVKRMARDAARFDWYFGRTDKIDFMQTYLTGMKDGWTPDQWRAAIDAAMKGV